MTQTYNPNTWEAAEGSGMDSRLSLAEIVTVSLGYMRLSGKKNVGMDFITCNLLLHFLIRSSWSR